MRPFALVVAAGCSFTHGAIGTGDGGGIGGSDGSNVPADAPMADTPFDAPAGNCYGPTGAYEICLAQPPTLSFDVGSRIDTGDPGCATAGGVVLGQLNGPDLCAIPGVAITVSGTLVATGPRPLVLVASDTILVNGILDVSSNHNGQSGAGHDPMGCIAGTVGGDDSSGGGGGAGGSFGTQGGDGGSGDSGNGTAGKASAAIGSVPIHVRGGCYGRHGGNETTGGGTGGGAVYLLAQTKLTISGEVDASGAAGRGGGTSRHGGAGGGSGGMIALWSTSVVVSGNVFANGGGAGQGADNNTSGADGFESANPQQIGAGGNTSSAGGAGGDGPIGGGTGAPGTSSSNGGGGGGGGQGVIHVVSGQPLGGAVSPPPT